MKKTAYGRTHGGRRGAAHILTIIIFLIMLMIASVVWEYLRLVTITRDIRDTMTDATVAAIAENAYNAYGGVREGYSGMYRISDEDHWDLSVVKNDVLDLTSETLRMERSGDRLSGYAYTIEVKEFDIDVEQFAPYGASPRLRTSAELVIGTQIPHDFGWAFLPPADVDIKVDASFVARF
jgi:hypothetical protein